MDDEPKVEQLENRIDKLESTIEKMMPSRRDALKMGGAALAGGSLMAGTSSAGTNQVGTIGSASQPVDLESEDINNADTITSDTVETNLVQSSQIESNKIKSFDLVLSPNSQKQFDPDKADPRAMYNLFELSQGVGCVFVNSKFQGVDIFAGKDFGSVENSGADFNLFVKNDVLTIQNQVGFNFSFVVLKIA